MFCLRWSSLCVSFYLLKERIIWLIFYREFGILFFKHWPIQWTHHRWMRPKIYVSCWFSVQFRHRWALNTISLLFSGFSSMHLRLDRVCGQHNVRPKKKIVGKTRIYYRCRGGWSLNRKIKCIFCHDEQRTNKNLTVHMVDGFWCLLLILDFS